MKKFLIILYIITIIFIIGLIPGSKSFLKDFTNTFISAVGVSFYSSCVPPQTIHLGFAATCFHWLSKKPCIMKNTIHYTLNTDPKEKELYFAQAADDWELILLQRAQEMVTGEIFIFNIYIKHIIIEPVTVFEGNTIKY